MSAENSLKGIAELTAQLKSLGALDDGKAIRGAVAAGIKLPFDRAHFLIPRNKRKQLHKTYKGRLVAPGFSERSIATKITVSSNKQQASAFLSVASEAFYAVQFVERGTRFMKAQPWLRPAFEATDALQLQAMQEYLTAYIEKLSKVTP